MTTKHKCVENGGCKAADCNTITYKGKNGVKVKASIIPLPKTRMVITHSPNYMVVKAKIVYDSSNKKLNKGDWRKVFVKHHETGEDSETRTFHVPASLTNEEVLKFVNSNMEIASPVTMFWNDVGIIARRFMREVMDGHKNKNLDLNELIKKYNKKIKESSKACSYPLTKRNKKYL